MLYNIYQYDSFSLIYFYPSIFYFVCLFLCVCILYIYSNLIYFLGWEVKRTGKLGGIGGTKETIRNFILDHLHKKCEQQLDVFYQENKEDRLCKRYSLNDLKIPLHFCSNLPLREFNEDLGRNWRYRFHVLCFIF